MSNNLKEEGDQRNSDLLDAYSVILADEVAKGLRRGETLERASRSGLEKVLTNVSGDPLHSGDHHRLN